MVIDTVVVGLIKTNCYIVYNYNSKECVVIDPGDRPQIIIEHLDGKGLVPKYTFITHGHYDHFSAVPALRERYGHIELVIHAQDAVNLSDRKRSHYRGMTEIGEADIIVEDGKVITLDGLEFKWLHTPGHSLGSCSILCGDALFAGDTLFLGDCGRCDLYGGSYPRMLESLKRLAELDGNPAVYPGHGPSTTMENERKSNAYMREATGLGPPVYS